MRNIGFKLLRDGSHMPIMGLGTFQAQAEDVSLAVDCALTVGYRHVDTAASYQNESAIGNVIDSLLRSNKIKRKDLFVTTKLPGYAFHNETAMKTCFEKSLDSLKLNHVDMYLVHIPWGMAVNAKGEREVREGRDLETIWRQMEQFHAEGKAKAIGLSNFSIRQIDRIWNMAKVKPQNLQLESHAFLQQANLRAHCQDKGIVVTAYSPLGSKGRPKRYHHASQSELLDDPVVNSIAKDIGKTPSQILLKFLMELGMIPLPKSTNPGRIEENLKALDVTLSPMHMESLRKLDRGTKYFRFDWAKVHPEYVPNEEF